MVTAPREITLKAENMTCAGCAEDMEKVLQDIEGILKALVTFSDEMIYIVYDAGIITRDQVFSAAENLGFKTKIISET